MSCGRAAQTDLDAVLASVSAPEALGYLAHCRECVDCAGALIERQEALAAAVPDGTRRTRKRKGALEPPVADPGEESPVSVARPGTSKGLRVAGAVAVLALGVAAVAGWLMLSDERGSAPPPSRALSPPPEAPEGSEAPLAGPAEAASPSPAEEVPTALPTARRRPEAPASAAAPGTLRTSTSGKPPRDGFEPAVILEDYAVELVPRMRHSLSLVDLPGNSPIEFSLAMPQPLPEPVPVEVTVVAPQRQPFQAEGVVISSRPDRVRAVVDGGFLGPGTYIVSAQPEGHPRALRYVLEVR